MASKLKLDKELELLRAKISEETAALPGGKAESEQRKKACAEDLELFAKTYFPHYLKSPCSKLHLYLADKLKRIVLKSAKQGEGTRSADAAPRGNAKSTWTSLIAPIWAALHEHKHFIILVSDTGAQARDFLSFIAAEMEANRRLAQDFPDAVGIGARWRADDLILNNGVRIRSLGSGQRPRGMRWKNYRPDLVIFDDIENDENVLTPEQRQKLEHWFFKAMLKLGMKDCDYLVVGTILHYASLLSNLLTRPGWHGKKFQAVIQWASNQTLWDRWASIFANGSDDKEEAERRADEFFSQNKEAMLAGSEVLWSEVEDYYTLMKLRVTDGEASFDSEKQNEPINPEDALFKEEWIQFWDEETEDVSGLPLYGVVDPSLGKKAKGRDPSAIIGGMPKNRIIYLDIADIEKRSPDKIITDVLAYHRRKQFSVFGVESVQFQEFFAGQLEKEAHKQELTLNVHEIQQHSDKYMRIQKLQPWIKNGWIKFKRSHIALIKQLVYFPMADHDDGPDGLEMLVTLIENVKPGRIEYTSLTNRDERKDDNAEMASGVSTGY